MSKSFRIVWILALAVFLQGCSGFRSIPIQGENLDQGVNPVQDVLEPNDRVRITQTNGNQLEGEISRFGDDGLILNNEKENGEELWILYSTVEKLEVFEENPAKSLGLATAIVGGIVVGYLVYEEHNIFSPDINGK